MKTVVMCGDMHCGIKTGLTPPSHWVSKKTPLGKVQRALWDKVERFKKDIGPIDFLCHNGDAIDGTGHRSGGTELLTTDRDEQADIATECLKFFNAKQYGMTTGTAYHTGAAEEFEKQIAKELGCKIGGHEWYQVDDIVFDVKHHVGSSSVPYGRSTAITKSALWGQIWADEFAAHPKGSIYCRSHVHYYGGAFGGSSGREWFGLTLPALCGLGSRFGVKLCEGLVHFGLVVFYVEGSEWDWSKSRYVVEVKEQMPKVTKL